MNRPGTDQAVKITNEFQEIQRGRRISLDFPLSVSTSRRNFVSAVVLDSAVVAGGDSECSCAALVVPRHRENEWVYSSEAGQWQLLASAGVRRIILLFPPERDPLEQVECQSRRRHEEAARTSEDEELENILRPLVLALSPKILFNRGIPDIPFLNYTDNVAQSVEKEVAYSSLTGFMMVADVELKSEFEEEGQSFCVSRTTAQYPGTQHESSEPGTASTWRRRLIFQRMPNLIQTEVPLIICPSQDPEKCRSQRKKATGSGARRKKGVQETQTRDTYKRVVDHSRLVHKYLPPIVAGFVLISPLLDASVYPQHKAKVFCIGVGGGALPSFLHHQFGFHIKVVELDEVVLDLARKHFDLKDGPNFDVTAGDGLNAVAMIARRAISAGFVNERLRTEWSSSFSDDRKPFDIMPTSNSAAQVADLEDDANRAFDQNRSSGTNLPTTAENGPSVCNLSTDSESHGECKCADEAATAKFGCFEQVTGSWSAPSRQRKLDPRVEIIIVDVDARDARSELSAPIAAFLERKFLLSALVALKEGGMLAMNVISSTKNAYEGVIEALAATFEEIHEILLGDDFRHSVMFALTKPSCYEPSSVVGPTVELVQRVVDAQLIHKIRRLK